MRSIYLDNNATTRLDPRVLEAMTPFFVDSYGNASSIHTYGQKARAAVEDARRQVADLLGAQPQEIVFTSGGTESDNTAIRGVAHTLADKGRHIVTTPIEHPAVLRTCEQLAKEGFSVTCVPVDREGIVRIGELAKALTDQTILVSVMHVNNETGTIQPLSAIGELTQERKIVLHTDAVQSAGKIPLDLKSLGIDLASFSAHKLHGPKGMGVLYVRRGARFKPLLVGGSHERGRRAGTENVPGIVGVGRACQLAREALDEMNTRVRSLRDRLEQTILDRIPQSTVNGSRTERAPHVTNISFRGVEGEALLISLDFQGVAVSTGSACSSGSLEPSHVLQALGQGPDMIRGSIRFSLSRMTTEEDIDHVLDILPATVARIREMSPSYREG